MGLSAATAGLLLGAEPVVGIPLSAVVPALTVRPRLQRPLLLFFMACYAAGWIGLWRAPRSAPWLWMAPARARDGHASRWCSPCIGLRARTPETTAALSTVAQGWGYVLAGAGPLLVGVLRGTTGGYTGMFVLVLAGVVGPDRDRLAGHPAALRRRRGARAGRRRRSATDVLEVAGAEAPVDAHVRTGDGSPRG